MRVVVDEQPIELSAGATVLDAVNGLGISLPQLCKDADRAPLGACRTCLVHVEGVRGTPASCHLPARDGMVVSTTHPDAAFNPTEKVLFPAQDGHAAVTKGDLAAYYEAVAPIMVPHIRARPGTG